MIIKNMAMQLKYIIFIAFIAMLSCDNGQEQEHSEDAHTEKKDPETSHIVELTTAQYQTAGIALGTTTLRSLSNVVTASGMIDIPPQNLVSVSAPMGGFVKKTALLQGMKVKKGDVLAVIANPDFIQIQQDYLETEGQLGYAEAEFHRQEELSRENVSARKTFEKANSELRILKARQSGLKERLRTAGINLKELEKGKIVDYANIISPLTGSVTAVNINIGKYVNPTDVMFEIVDTDHLHVELSVFEKDISKLKIGQLVRFRVNTHADREGLAEVYLINPRINEDRTVRVHCHLLKNDKGLLPQNFVRAVIETGSSPVSSLPDQAITDFEGKSYIFIEKGKEEEDGKPAVFLFEMLEIERGASQGGYSQVILPAIMNGKQPGIVLKGAYTLLSKLKNSADDEHGH
jgi:cobalt-zinc-cadmium efflux system membrane fusion protein